MTIKHRFWLWLVVVIVGTSWLLREFALGLQVNTNVLDLLPKSLQKPTINKAADLFAHAMGKQLIILIGNKDKEVAQKAASSFYQQIQPSPLLQKITYCLDTNEQQSWGKLYFPHRLSLLAPEHKSLLLQNKSEQLRQKAMQDLYSPLGITSAAMLQHDPFLLLQHYLMSLPNPATKIVLQDQRMMASAGDNWYVMLNATLSDNSFSITTQKLVVELLQKSKEVVCKNFPATQVLMNGMLFYAEAGAKDAEHDIAVIGIGSLLGIVLFCLLAFRSLIPFVYTLLSALSGFMFALIATKLVFGTVHLFTLILGASVVGLCVDYSFFYYADRLVGKDSWYPELGLKNIFSGISLGLLNIILAYSVLSFTPFPGLQQLAVFAIAGLFMAYATVVCVFPLIPTPKYNPKKASVLLGVTNSFLNFCLRLSTKKKVVIFSGVVIVIVSGIWQLKSNDDIRILQTIPSSLVQTESQIKEIIGNNFGMDFYMVFGDSPEQTLINEHLLTTRLNVKFPDIDHKYMAISSYLPSATEQKENFSLVKKHLINDRLGGYLQKIGVKKNDALVIQKNLVKLPFLPLTMESWLASPASKPIRFLWLGKVGEQFVSVVLLSNKLVPAQLKSIEQDYEFVTYVNKANDVSKMFKTYRGKTFFSLLTIYGIVWLLLWAKYSFKRAFLYLTPAVCANALSLSIMGWLAIPLTLFNTLALILVLGIAMDYVFFFGETKGNYEGTMLATSLSAIATILSFGLLIFSNVPVLYYFGLTVLVGVSSSFFLTPLVVLKLKNNC